MTVSSSTAGSVPHVIVVGLGIVGLAAAIECREKGLTVTAFDKSDILEPIGDCIGIPSNASRIIQRWGNGKVGEILQPWVVTSKHISIHNSSGQRILRQDLSEVCKDTNYLIARSELVRVMYEHARTIGVRMELGATASNPVEDEDGSEVVITTKNSTQVYRADFVIMSDGVHSTMRRAIMGEPAAARPTGYAAFRACVDVKAVAEDPEARWVLEDSENHDRFDVFFLDGVQIAVQSCNGGRMVTWFCLHEDTTPSQAVWTTPANPDDVFELLSKWPVGRRLWAVIRHTPRHKFINYPLINHQPLDRWVSKRQRSILIGDAAHPLSPAAGQGAAQGIEDANVLAVCVQLAAKRKVPIPLALQVTERIRYPRASAIQVTSHRANEGWRRQNWDLFDPRHETIASLPLEEWIFGHDSQAYTMAEFEHVVAAIQGGKPYLAHNLPETLRSELAISTGPRD